ncbi:Methyltransferase domain-containing protein [Cnuella takakiae]|uniref:Methyltransferase domain-containing protein n=1 Tax=Cnuella takakiae TaxID=1302690 RepID=A0A1M4WMB2_9BACT|nr:methyltransferase domain-containing protein [Cnuella takakiae]OLY91678.1 SAM-dependent methyltransferase [Cnuella takakiae]SHE82335.1 Methyltransferase domain-containing protein [Cnuella takakiae]
MFATRSYTPELLDQPHIPFADIRQNMRELDTINTLLGGHAITLKGLQKLVPGQVQQAPVSILEIGCGDGNNLRVVQQWAERKGLSLQLTGVDYNPECIAYARQLPANNAIQFICSDYRTVAAAQKSDIVFSSLFCHHFTDAQLVEQLQWMQANSNIGFFINDLHRHPLAYHSIRLLTRLFSKSYLVKNDAPLSVLRGFKRGEWRHLLKEAKVDAQINWAWAFRWLIVCNLSNTQL